MNTTPRVSFGLAVRNGERTIHRVVDSILAQTFTDFELVLSDNASTDATPEICREYARRDPRVVLIENPEDIGQILNVNQVCEVARGEYFRWIGSDDWLEPEYAARCVELLDSRPDIIATTTYFTITDGEGRVHHQPYEGPFVEQDECYERFGRMLWFFHAGDALWDPLYGMIRRSAMEPTPLIRMMACADWMLAAQLALMGRFTNIPECLAHRDKIYAEYDDHDALLKRYHPKKFAKLDASAFRLARVLVGIVMSGPYSLTEKLRCLVPIAKFGATEFWRRFSIRSRQFARERLGLSRKRLGL